MKNRRAIRLVAISIAFTLLSITSNAFAESATKPVTKLDAVVVTATKYETEQMETPAFVTVITADELEKTGGHNLVEALRTISGLEYVSYGPLGTSHGGMNSELPIRGINDGELVLVNGVPINNPSGGSYDLNSIPLSAIERVEVVKGASSVLYGSAALAGVINIITKKQKEIKGQVNLEGGTESYSRDSFSLGNDKIFGSVSYLHLGKQKEISKNYGKKYTYGTEPLNQYSVSLSVNPLETISLNYLGSMEETDFIREPWESVKVTKSNSRKGSDQTIKKHFVNLGFKRDGFTLNNYYYRDDLGYKYDDGTPASTTEAYRYGFNPQYHREFGEVFDLLVGSDYQYDHVDTSKYGIHKKYNYSLSSTLTYKPIEKLSLSLGARKQWIEQPDADDYAEFCPQFQANYLHTPDLSFYINAGKAFRAPDLLKLYYQSSFLVGNPSLKPESGWSYEVGMRYRNPFVAVKLAPFLMKYEDKIEIDRSKGYPLTYYNANRFETKGVEWDIEAYPADCWTIGLAGYWADPVVEDTAGNEQQAGAKFQLSPSIGFDNNRFRIKTTVLMIRNRHRELDNFLSTNIVMGYKLWKGEATLSISNLFDGKNATRGDMTSTSTSRYEYYDTGRIISLGYKLDF
ncbi:TPA: TonB-dependent receptor [Candidatus Poribacteria bacterium]|nr:TonB-dependent receptor [Candidatus Poribacteria bacterium]